MTEADDQRHDPAAEEGSAGSADPSKAFRENPPDEGEIQEIEEERDRRLDPENRPQGSEIDNTGRTFNQDAWEFDDGRGGEGGVVDPTEPVAERGHGPDATESED